MYKNGDYILCKNDNLYLFYNFRKNKYYKINSIDEKIGICSENNSHVVYFSEEAYSYFYSFSEMRKLKLSKIKKSIL